MFEKLKQIAFNKLSDSQFVYDLITDHLEDAGVLTDSLDTVFECGYDDNVDNVPAARRRRRRRRRRSR